jgi:transcriptional regulator with XRE-family HTH domain
MASLLGVGEKTYTRWESGRSLHNKSSDLLIRLADRYAEMFAAVEAERQPGRDSVVQDYIARITTLKAGDGGAVAAHGADLSTLDAQSIRVRLVELNASGAARGAAQGTANGAAQGGPRGAAPDPAP